MKLSLSKQFKKRIAKLPPKMTKSRDKLKRLECSKLKAKERLSSLRLKSKNTKDNARNF